MAVFDDYVAAWNAGDLEAWLDAHAEDAEYTPLAAGDGRVYRGREELRETWRESRANWDRFAFAVVDEADGLVQVEFSGIESLNATRVAGTLWFRVHERDGRIARLWSALEPGALPG
jgi:hypothetical protein